MPCVNRPLNGSAMPIRPICSQRPGPEARVEQVQDRMLDPADILRDREPLLGLLTVERPVARLAGEANEIPGGIDEGVERVGLARRCAAAARAVDMLPRRMPIERIAGNVEADVLGQDDRQLVARNRHRAAALAMHDRDRRAPVTLARHAPVAQAPGGRALAPAGDFGAADDFGGGLVGGEAVEEVGIDRDPGLAFGFVADRKRRLCQARRDDPFDRQA